MHSVIQERKYHYERCHFAICEFCYWTATMLDMDNDNRNSCPMCVNKILELIPLNKNEKYYYKTDSKRGLDIELKR